MRLDYRPAILLACAMGLALVTAGPRRRGRPVSPDRVQEDYTERRDMAGHSGGAL